MRAQIMFELIVVLAVAMAFIATIMVMSMHFITAGDSFAENDTVNGNPGAYAGIFSR